MKPVDLKIDEFTTPSPLTATVTNTADEIKKIMLENKVRHIPIEDDGEIVGIVSDRDIKTLSMANGQNIVAKDFMSPEIFSTYKGTPLEEVVLEMSKRKIGSAIVNGSDGALYGIFTSTDALNALVEVLRGDV